jgi:hypothetical protein
MMKEPKLEPVPTYPRFSVKSMKGKLTYTMVSEEMELYGGLVLEVFRELLDQQQHLPPDKHRI